MAKTRRTGEAGARTEPTRAGRPRQRMTAEQEGPLFRRVNYILFGAALAVIAIGFVFLAGGSITMAPLLLVLGYAVLVPLAILYRPRPGRGRAAEPGVEKPGE